MIAVAFLPSYLERLDAGDDILPMLKKAVERVAEEDKAMQPPVAGRV